jgi:hypothetical protein
LPPELLPVREGMFAIDGLLQDQSSLSLQRTGGRVVRTYINGTQIAEIHFTLFYRSVNAAENEDKSIMLGILDGIGTWLTKRDPPYLGDGFRVLKLEQIQLANVVHQTAQQITYQAGYALEFETKP